MAKSALDELIKKNQQDVELEELLKRKKKEWDFMLAAVLDKQQTAEIEQFKARFKDFIGDTASFEKAGIPAAIQKATEIFYTASYNIEKVQAYFAIDDEMPEAPKLRESLHDLDISENQFATAAMIATGRKSVSMTEFLRSHQKRTPKEMQEMKDIKDSGVKKAMHAIFAYKDGNPATYAKLLAQGIRTTCTNFANEGNPKVAMEWSFYTQGILDMLRKSPVLMEHANLSVDQMGLAMEVASLGNDIKHGLEAADLMAKVAAGKIPPEKVDKKQLSERILKMHIASKERTVLDVQEKWKQSEERLWPEDPEFDEPVSTPQFKTPGLA